jgi:hypothetical protein
MSRDYARRVAMGELVRTISLALGTTSEDARKFALPLLARIAALANDGAALDPLKAEQIPFWLAMYEQVREKETIQ